MISPQRPRVSFVVTCHNYGRFLDQALRSLLAQTLGSWEALVIDDASTDHTQDVLAGHLADPRVRAVQHPRNLGNIRSYNEGLDMLSGEFVGILSADDYLLSPRALERQVAVFDANPDVGLVYSAHTVMQDGAPVRQVVPWPADGVHRDWAEFRKLMWGNYVLHSGALLRREVERELGPYEAALTHTGDWDMWLRAAARHPVGYLADALYAYRIHGTNMFHRGLSPYRQTDQVVATVDRAFAWLPRDAPADLLAARPAVRSHALLQTAWFDLYNGRRRRTWGGIAYALRRRPAMAWSGEPWRLLPRAVLMTGVGRERYRAISARLERAGGGHGVPPRRGSS